MAPRNGTSAIQEQNISKGKSTSTADVPSGPARKPILAQPPKSAKHAQSDDDDDIIFMASYSHQFLKSADVPSNGKASAKGVPVVVPSRSMESLRTPADQPAAQVNAVGVLPAKGSGKIASVDLNQKMTSSDDDIVLIGVVAAMFDVNVDRVITQDVFDRQKLKNAGKSPYIGSRDVSIDEVHEVFCVWGTEAESRKPAISRRIPLVEALVVEVFVKVTTGNTITCLVDLNDSVKQLKHQVAAAEGIAVDQQHIIFSGIALEDDRLLSYYGIKEASMGHLALRSFGEMWTLIIKNDFLDPLYNYDFTYHVPDIVQFMRGGEVYERPIGWKRIAINVGSKYRDNVDWLGQSHQIPLGPDGIRTFSVTDEWPVSYHGTKKEHANDIAGQGLQLAKCTRFAFGRGIYSTPSLNVAEMYAQEFVHHGTKMKVIFQNRVNPKTLVKVSKERTGFGEYWISPTGSDIRPYGICYKMIR